MTDIDCISILKNGVTISSFLVAIIGFLRSQRQKQLVSASLWSLYIKQQNGFLISQQVVKLYKEIHQSNIDPLVLEWASKAESFNQHIFEDIMKQIYVADNKLTVEKVNRYFSENKISEYDKKFFQMMINEPSELTWKDRLYKCIGIPL